MISISTILDRSTEFIADHRRALVPFALLILLVAAVQQIVEPLAPAAGPVGKAGLGVLRLALSLGSLWAQLAIVAIALGIRGAPARVATSRFGAALGVYLAVFATIAVVVAPGVIALAQAGVDFGGTDASAELTSGPALAFGGIYLAAALAVLVWIGSRLIVLTPVIVAERRGVGAIARAFRLTKGLTWKLIGALLLFGIVVGVATLATKAVFGSVFGLLLGGDDPVTAATVITAIATAAVSAGFTTLAAIFVTMLYNALTGEGAPPAAS